MSNIIIKQKILRIVFFGTTSFSAYHLHALINFSICQIIAVFTQSNNKSTKKTSYNHIEKIAKKNKLQLFKSNNIFINNITQIIQSLNIDLIIVVSYGLLLPKEILDIPKLGCINVHASLLPRWRGAAPIQRALEHGDSVTGISIIKMDTGIDTGNILYSIACNISPTDTSYSLTNKLAKIGTIALLLTIKKIFYGIYNSIPQNKIYATYAKKLCRNEAYINWKLSAIQIERKIRAFNPWPTSFFYIKKKRVKVWDAKIDKINKKNIVHTSPHILPGTILKANTSGIYVSTGYGILTLTVLQIEGKKKTSVANILNAYKRWFLPNTIIL